MPGRVDQQFQAIVYGVIEVDRQGVAMRHAARNQALRQHVGVHAPQRGQAVHAERNLVDHIERQFRRAVAGQDELMMLGGGAS
jgi:hypothetical protein